MFLIYIIVLENRETLENSKIDIWNTIANACWNLQFFCSFLVTILYRFKTAIEFLSISTIENAILKYIL